MRERAHHSAQVTMPENAHAALLGREVRNRMGELSSGAAAEMASVPRIMFLDLCAEHDIPVSQVCGDDLRRELALD